MGSRYLSIPVDTGFIVFNDRNYPNLTALFERLGVEIADSDMSFGISLQNGGFEYSGSDLAGLFAQPANIVKPAFWAMLADIKRFYRRAPDYLASVDHSVSISIHRISPDAHGSRHLVGVEDRYRALPGVRIYSLFPESRLAHANRSTAVENRGWRQSPIR